MRKKVASLLTTILLVISSVQYINAEEIDTTIYNIRVFPEFVSNFEKDFENDEFDEYIEMDKRNLLYFEEGSVMSCMVVIKKKYSEYKKQWKASDFNIENHLSIGEYTYADPDTLTEEEYMKLGIEHQYLSMAFGPGDAKNILTALKESGKVLFVSPTINSNTSSIRYGNVDNNEEVDISDLTLVSQYLLGDIELNLRQQINADVNADDEVNLQDLALLKQYVMNDNVQLGVVIK